MSELPRTQSNSIIQGLEASGIEFVVYLPDSTIQHILSHFNERPEVTLIPVAREEEGIGILAGLEAAGRKGVFLIQDSGVGNFLNTYITLAALYQIPMLTIAGRRGGFHEINRANAAFGEVAPSIMEAANLRTFTLDYTVPLAKWSYTVEHGYQYAQFMQKPILLFVNLKDQNNEQGI